MKNKELKEKIEQIMKNKAVIGTVGDVLEEIDFEDVAEEIVNLLPIHDVSLSTNFAEYLSANWDYLDNTKNGNVYRCHYGDNDVKNINEIFEYYKETYSI